MVASVAMGSPQRRNGCLGGNWISTKEEWLPWWQWDLHQGGMVAICFETTIIFGIAVLSMYVMDGFQQRVRGRGGQV